MVNDALVQLFEEHHPVLLQIARTIVRDESMAQDVCQEVFLKSLAEPRLYVPDFDAGAWLRTVTRNMCLTLRRDTRTRTLLLDLRAEEVLPPEPLLPTDLLTDAELRAALNEAVARLPKAQRQVIVLMYYWEKARPEIARMLGISQDTVSSRVARAQQRLADDLESQGVR